MATDLKTYNGKTYSSVIAARKAQQRDISMKKQLAGDEKAREQALSQRPAVEQELRSSPATIKQPSGDTPDLTKSTLKLPGIGAEDRIVYESLAKQLGYNNYKYGFEDTSGFTKDPQFIKAANEFYVKRGIEYNQAVQLRDAQGNVTGKVYQPADLKELVKQYDQSTGDSQLENLKAKNVQAKAEGAKATSPGLVDKAFTEDVGGDLLNLQNNPWWKNAPQNVKEDAYAQVQSIVKSPESLADYVLSKGLTDLQQYKWWSQSPHKQKAWEIVQSKQPGQQGGQPNIQAEIQAITDQGNQEQEGDFATIQEETDVVDLSKSAELVDKLLQSLEEGPKVAEEAPKTLQQIFTDEKQKLALGELETELSTLDSELAQLDADYSSTVEGTEQQRAPMGSIRRNLSETQLQYNRKRRDMVAERDSVARELNTKYSILNTMVSLAGQDIDNAQQDYQNKFNRNVQMINLLKGVEQEEKTDQERKTDNARANVQIMTNLLKEGNIDYANLDASTLLDIKNMEIQAGLPVGFTSFVNKTVDEPVVSFLTPFTNEQGNRIQPVGVKNADGTFSVKNINLGGIADKDTQTESTKTQDYNASMWKQLDSVAGSNGYISVENYKKARSAWGATGLSSADFDKRFASFRNPDDDYYDIVK